MASLAEQLEELRKEKEVITTTGLGASDATTYIMQGDLDRINKQIDSIENALGLGASGTAGDIADIFNITKEPIPDFYSEDEDIDLLRQWESEGIRGINLTPEFKEMSPKGWGGGEQEDVLQDILDSLPMNSPYRALIQRKLELAKSGQQISFLNPSSSQYLMNQHLMNQQKNLNPWMNMPGVQVAGTDLTGMGIPNALQQQQQQAELMHAGNLALHQTPAQVQAQGAAAQATQQGNYQAPTMTQQQMVQEAQQTGGTVNPHEATQAVSAPRPRPSRPRYGPHGKAHGGVVSLMDLLNRRV